MTELPASVRLRDDPTGAVVEVDHPSATAEVHLHGAHVTSWAPADRSTAARTERLWLSPDSSYGPDAAIRGGVPICLPWFAKGPGDWEPQHGFARRVRWRFDGAVEDVDGVTVRLRLTDADLPAGIAGRDVWPHRFRVDHTVRIGRTLDLDLHLTNTGEESIRVGGALHTYLRVDDIGRTSLSGLDGVRYHDKVHGGEHDQHGPVTFTGETDRIYRGTDPVTVRDGDTDLVAVHPRGASATVVWNPWQDKAATMDDLPDDGWQHMVCVEAAIPDDSAVVLAPGSGHHLAQRLIPA